MVLPWKIDNSVSNYQLDLEKQKIMRENFYFVIIFWIRIKKISQWWGTPQSYMIMTFEGLNCNFVRLLKVKIPRFLKRFSKSFIFTWEECTLHCIILILNTSQKRVKGFWKIFHDFVQKIWHFQTFSDLFGAFKDLHSLFWWIESML